MSLLPWGWGSGRAAENDGADHGADYRNQRHRERPLLEEVRQGESEGSICQPACDWVRRFFSAGGDSGSLIVEDVATCPHAVGLVVAGSSTITIANPISDVLGAFGVSIGGCTTTASQEKSLFRTIVAWLFPTASAAPGAAVNPAAIVAASQTKDRHEQALLSMSMPGVVGVGVGLSTVAPDQVVIQVYVERDTLEVRQAVPAQLDSTPVEIVETGPIVAHGGGCGEAS